MTPTPRIILASTSPTRHMLLAGAGVLHEVVAPKLDEEVFKAAHSKRGQKPMAGTLAKAKALSVDISSALILGADQTLDLEGQRFDKPGTYEKARAQLSALRGKMHQLHSAVVMVRDGTVVFSHTETSHLTMRAFSDVFLEEYLKALGTDAFGAVGCYHVEGLGLQLFERVEGDYHAILGLPLLPLLAFLRSQDIIAS